MSFDRPAIVKQLVWGLSCCVFAWAAPQSTQIRADDDLASTAAAIAPQEAAFFATSVNLDDQWQEIIDGKFVARLRAVPFVQQLESEFWEQWENPQGPLEQAKGALENPNVQNLIKMADEMFSDEVFIYGGEDWCEMIDGLMEFQNEMYGHMSGGPEALQAYFQSIEKSDIDKIRIPTTVMGFRIDDDDNVRLQLDALEGILRLGGSQFEEAQPFLQKLKRSDLKEGQTLSISLEPSMIPLDQLDDEPRQMAEQIMGLLEGRSFSFAIGVKSNILLMAFGEGASVIDSVGDSENKLLDHEAFDVLKAAAPSNLRAINYASARWRDSQFKANMSGYFQRMTTQFSMAIQSEAENVPDLETWRAEIETDAQWLDQKIAELSPEFGPTLTWSFATADGEEGYQYDWSENVVFQNAAPLTVTSHAGEAPLALFGLKQRTNPGGEEIAEYLLERMPNHIRRFIRLAEDDEDDREQALSVLDEGWPLVREAYVIMRDKIGPAMDANESLFSMAADWTTYQLGPGMPRAETALPLPEMAIACTVSDRDLFIDGCVNMYELLDRVVDIVREHNPDSVPEGYTIPRPQEESINGSTRYFYRELSDGVPIEGFAPQLIISDDVLLLGYSDRQVRDMLQARPLQTRPAWMTPQTPTAAVVYADLAGMVSAVRPWIEFGLVQSGKDLDEPLANGNGPIPTGNDVLQIWDCFESAGKVAATTTVTKDGPTVSHWVWVTE